MKIVVLGIRGLPANYSGFETCADHTSKYWSESGNDVLVYCRKNRYSDRPKFHGAVQLRYITQIPLIGLETLSHTLFSIFDLIFFRANFKYVHLYNCGNALFLPVLKLFGKKTLISVDGIEWKRDKWGAFAKLIYKLGERSAVRWADEIIADNKEIESYYLKKYGKPTTVIAYGAKMIESKVANSEQYLISNELRKKEYFLFVGRLVPEKGVHNLIDAYNKLQTDIPLVIIGDDHSNTDYKKSLLNNRSHRIKFLGFRYGEEYEQLLANALLYVSASHLEGTSPSLLAAMGAKVCCLINDIPENRATVSNGAFLFQENNFDDLTRQWKRLIGNRQEIEKMSIVGYSKAIQRYSWRKISSDYIRAFRRLGSESSEISSTTQLNSQ